MIAHCLKKHQTFINKKKIILDVELIQLKEVSKKFGKNVVLEDINIVIEENDILGVIGQSGSGKTTFLNLIAGFLEPSEGKIFYHSGPASKPKDLSKNLYSIKKNIGFTPQHNSLYPKLTITENLLHFGEMYNLKKETLINNIKSLIHFTRLHEHRNKLAEQLSSGMQKRLDISCSLVHKPKVLILDEPTADLDPLLQQELLRFLKEINKQGVTIIIASHDLEGIEKICNKVAIIHKKTIRSQGLIEDVRKPFLKAGFTINLRPDCDKEKIIDILKNLPTNKIIDQGFSLSVLSDNTENTIKNLLSIMKEKELNFNEMDMRKLSLGEVFEKISQE